MDRRRRRNADQERDGARGETHVLGGLSGVRGGPRLSLRGASRERPEMLPHGLRPLPWGCISGVHAWVCLPHAGGGFCQRKVMKTILGCERHGRSRRSRKEILP